MAASSAVRSEKKLYLNKEGFLAKTLNLKPFACSEEYIGKFVAHTSYVNTRAVTDTQTDTHTHTGWVQ